MDQRQSAERIEELSSLDMARAGHVRLRLFDLDSPTASTPTDPVAYTLRAPTATVADADIRGYLDGETKYLFNQGTSYHMRVGRRYGGPINHEFELKRSLIRWTLPELPSTAEVASATVELWIEAFLTNSPLRDSTGIRPLHVYAYPVESDWTAGHGGIEHDDFSAPAPGEVSWLEPKADSMAWPAPGALAVNAAEPAHRYSAQPVAVAEITSSDRRIELRGERLTRYLRRRIEEGRPLDLLLKLDDQEEDRWGTELAFLSSNFGTDLDSRPRRPTLEIEVDPPFRMSGTQWPFVLEAGQESVLPIVELSGERVLVAPTLVPDGPGLPPSLYLRGGLGTPVGNEPWQPVTGPVERRWDWLQLKVSAAPNRIEWGDTLSLGLRATWVVPGPRAEQAPELALIAPSGVVHRISGRPVGDSTYIMQFRPDELGLWRFGWSFRPAPVWPLGSHEGEGFFYVGIPDGEAGVVRLQAFAQELRSDVPETPRRSPVFQARLNNLIRWAARHAQRGPAAERLSDSLVASVRQAIRESQGR